jgi:hypothetical protein
MDAPVPRSPLGSGWTLFAGIAVVIAAVNEVLSRVSHVPLPGAPKRPSLNNTVIVGLLVKEALGRIGDSATGRPAGG